MIYRPSLKFENEGIKGIVHFSNELIPREIMYPNF
ncbi:MAG: hypothetical protein ACI959_001695 [Limisphaerales bacterium]|jgi:hypothetical protein